MLIIIVREHTYIKNWPNSNLIYKYFFTPLAALKFFKPIQAGNFSKSSTIYIAMQQFICIVMES